ncbi:ABC transporter substrate-binding protein [Pseudomonas sp. NA-150]|uniref:ABC transporter substrate-binding protein n=1 Tax=Pseudomonas sp. NA-150 TaxID=3367525 RepID=UPI0037CCA922
MKKVLASTSLVLGLLGITSTAFAAACDTVTIASMNWQSAEVLSSIDKLVLEKGYGCNVEVSIGDTVPTITSMAEKGQPDIAPEAWVDHLADVVDKATKEGKLVSTTNVFSEGGVNGWWIPKYVADAHPDIKTIADMLKHPELFPNPEDTSRGAIYNGPQGWGWTIITSQLYKAYNAKAAGFDLIDTGSAAGLDGSIAKAYERKKGWVGYYWSPTGLLGKYQMVMLQPGVPYDADQWHKCITIADCPNPKPSAGPVDRVVTLVSGTFAKRANADVMAYLSKRSWKNNDISALMSWMADNQATGEQAAQHFLKTNPNIWNSWVSADAAAKIKSSL